VTIKVFWDMLPVVWNKCTNILGDDSAASISRVEIRYHTGGGRRTLKSHINIFCIGIFLRTGNCEGHSSYMQS